MSPNPGDTALRCFNRTVTLVRNHLPVVHGLKSIHVALLQHLLLALTERGAIRGPPPRNVSIVGVRILGLQHERRHELKKERLTVFEPRVVQCLQVDYLCVFQPCDTVAVVTLPAELEAVQSPLLNRQNSVPISVEVRVDT